MSKAREVIDILSNLTEGKEEAEYIRKKLKDELGLTNKDVSVRMRHGGTSSSVTVSIKTAKGMASKTKIEEIGREKESYDRDERTGEILAGGNTFIFTEIDYKFADQLKEKIQKEFEKQLNGRTLGDNLPNVVLFDTFRVNVGSRGDYFVTIKEGGRFPTSMEIRDLRYVGGSVLSLISKVKDDSLYAKIK